MLGAGPASFIGSGGMVPVAALSAQLHERATMQFARVRTPLEAITQTPIPRSGAMLLSASGKHPDAREVMRRLGRPGLNPGAVLTHRSADDLPDMPEVQVVTLPPLSAREGFLATGSVIAMAVALARAYHGQLELDNATLEEIDSAPWPDELDRLLVLYDPEHAPVACDVETRLSELGLAATQLSDFRNFAHGRHFGLQENAERTCILALVGHDSASLADATLDALPSRIPVIRWSSQLEWPQSTIQLMVQSIRVCAALAERAGVNLQRPGVGGFGRRLYKMPLRTRVVDRLLGPVDRKLVALGTGFEDQPARTRFDQAFSRWTSELQERRFGAIVLDYDGTVCATGRRFDPPEPSVANALEQALGRGLRLGFASGRGPSLLRDLRKVIDERHWPRVELGLYNGGVLCRLDEELGDLRTPSALIALTTERLQTLPLAERFRFDARCMQLTIEPMDGIAVRRGELELQVAAVLSASPALPVKIVSSGHSIDVVPNTSSKVAVVDRVRHREGPIDVLCIGDQGQIGGNDHELLANERWSLTVDACSADPTRCWYFGHGNEKGPRLLVRYLSALRRRGRSAALIVARLR